MGLDMYLSAKLYVGGWNHNRHPAFDKIVAAVGITPDEGSPCFHVDANVGYWRKANAVHAWFVRHVQDGIDECQRVSVDRKQLEQLRAACQEVLASVETVEGKVADGSTHYADGRVEYHSRDGAVIAQPAVAARVLPTQGGFFFGKTDYDEDYLADLRDTVAIVDRVLNAPEMADCSFEYHASW